MRRAEQKLAEAREKGDAYWIHYWETVIATVDRAPEFTPTLKDQLRILLRPTPAPVAPIPVRRIPVQLPRTQKADPLVRESAAAG